MNRVWITACALLLLSVAAFAGPAPTPAPVPVPDSVIAAILGEPAGAASCAKPAAARAGVAGLAEKATCTANCQGGGTVTCTSSGSCTAVNGDCSVLEPGHVTCNGVTTNCTPACCSTGTMIQKACCRCEATGGCVDCCRCDGGTLAQCALACS